MAPDTNVITGPVLHARNLAADLAGSIHDDETASALGFRGGTVAGSVHMDQFPPLLLDAFGRRWFETGSLSLYFRNARVDNEPVQAFLERPPTGAADPQVRAWATDGGDTVIAEGTASVGQPTQPSALRGRDLRPVDPSELRIMRNLRPGDSLGELTLTPDGQRTAAAIAKGAMTEPLDWYTGSSPWGGRIASPSAVVNLLYSELLAPTKAQMGPRVGLFGAIEVRFHRGPVLIGTTYTVTGEIVALSQTPQTEVLWYDSRALGQDGKVVADMRMMLRSMKAASPLYRDREAADNRAGPAPGSG